MQVISPKTEEEFESYYHLRWLILRKPWKQIRGSEIAIDENIAKHALVLDANNKAIAVGRLHFNDPGEAQIRFVAVATEHRGKGYGNLIMDYLEEKAKSLKAKKIILEAREPVVEFYEKRGYILIEKSYLLFDEIQHYTMSKLLK